MSLNVGWGASPHDHVLGSLCTKGQSVLSKRIYSFMVSVCFEVGCLCPTCRFKALILTWSGDVAALCLHERLEEKRLFNGLSRLWIELYIPLNSFANELDPVALWCEPPEGQTDTLNCIFYFLDFSSPFAYAHEFDICVDHPNSFTCWQTSNKPSTSFLCTAH